MDSQVEQAVDLVSNPSQGNPDLKRQALEFLQQVKESPEGSSVCLQLVTRIPKPSDTVRLFALDVVNTALQSRYHELNTESLVYIRDTIMDYIRRSYFDDPSQIDIAAIQNKLTQTITILFTQMYTSSWRGFFSDLSALTSKASAVDGQTQRDNLAGVVLFLRLMMSIHDEIADVLLNRSPEENKRNVLIKDHIREQDVGKLVLSWQEILAQWRGVNDEIVEMTLKVIARWVSWIDISLVVNDVFLRLLFGFLEGGNTQGAMKIRHAAVDALTEIVGKKMQGGDKLQLIAFLNLTNTVNLLVSLPELQKDSSDSDLVEAVARLVNTVVADLVKMLDLDNKLSEASQQEAETVLSAWVPHLLHFFSNEYDDVSLSVLPALDDLLTHLRKEKRVKGTILPSHHAMLEPTLNVVIMKTKYDDDSTWGEDDDQTDETEFLELRRRMQPLQEAIANTDEELYQNSLASLVANTFTKARHNAVDWRELDLALYEMFLFGQVAVKIAGLYGTNNEPNSPAAAVLIQMMAEMMECDIGSFDHPAIKLLFMDIAVRYWDFYEHRKEYITPALEIFVRCVHDKHRRVQVRSWYLFQKFVRAIRVEIGDFAINVIEAIGDLLEIKAELSSDSEDADGEDDMSSDDSKGKGDVKFDSLLNLFEAVGTLSSSPALSSDKQEAIIQAVLSPIFSDVQKFLEPARNGDQRAVLQIHHDVMAMGNLAKGFAEGVKVMGKQGERPVPNQFSTASDIIIVSLENLRMIRTVREAAAFSFTRMVTLLGKQILPLLSRWIEGLLAENSTKEEMSTFLRLLNQLVFGFKNDIYDYLNKLLTPLLGRIFQALQQPTSGTDEELEASALRKEYLNFLSVILNNDLGNVFTSDVNRAYFESLLQTVEHFAKEVSDPGAERQAFALMGKMSSVWGGPEIPSTVIPSDRHHKRTSSLTGGNLVIPEALPGFEGFMMERFSNVCWEVPANGSFDSRDAQAKTVLQEIATLQKTIYGRSGEKFISFLRGVYFPSNSFPQNLAEEYLTALQSLDLKNFKKFFQTFVQQRAQ